MKAKTTKTRKTAHKSRPKKAQLDPAEVQAKKALSLSEKQDKKLELQKQKEAAKAGIEPKNKDRFYCTNKELHQELLKWRISGKHGAQVLKKIGNKLVETEVLDTPEKHEKYMDGIQYFVKLSKIDDSYDEKYVDKDGKEKVRHVIGPDKKLYDKALSQFKELKIDKFAEDHRTWVLHDITSIVKREGWTFNYDVIEDRELTDKLGNMMIAIGDKLLNHNNFRNYNYELKLDMRSQFFVKLLKGLKNYNFKFNNPFAFFTTTAWNSFLIVLNQHYKHQNIRKEIMQKMVDELQSCTGISPNAGLTRCINAYLDNDRMMENG